MSVQYGGDNITFADGSTLGSGWTGFKNRIINGAMMIDQRNAGASVTNTAGSVYTLDRWQASGSQASKFTVQQSSTAPTGFKNSLLVTSSSAYTVGSSEVFRINQTIEGFNISDLGWGASGASTITLSFWVRSSLTGTFGGALLDASFAYSYPFTYTISAANTWEQKTVTITGPTSGTFGSTNGAGFTLTLSLGAGSTFSGTAGSWASATYTSATGATSVVGTNGATFYITGVQLEKGSTATSFDYRPYGTELALCQRYYERWQGNGMTMMVPSAATSYCINGWQYKTTKRASPTVGLFSGTSLTNILDYWGVGSITPNSAGSGNIGPDSARLFFALATTYNQGITFTVTDSDVRKPFYADAEL